MQIYQKQALESILSLFLTLTTIKEQLNFSKQSVSRESTTNNKSPFAIIRLNSLLNHEQNLIKYIEKKEKVSEVGCLYGSVREGGKSYDW